MSKITGIGGVFLNMSGNTKKLLNWYDEVLELNITEYGINFLVPNKLTLITFDNKENESSILNFTVDNLENFMKIMRAKGVKIIKDISFFDYGKFAQIEDILGNCIELWEPFEKEYIQMVEKEILDFKQAKE